MGVQGFGARRCRALGVSGFVVRASGLRVSGFAVGESESARLSGVERSRNVASEQTDAVRALVDTFPGLGPAPCIFRL